MGGTVSTGNTTGRGGTAEQVIALVEAFDIDELDDVEGLAEAVVGTTTFEPGDLVCVEGEASSRWWVVLDGRALVTVRGQRVGAVSAGEVVGEIAALAGTARVASVTATTQMTAIEIDSSGFVDRVMSCPPAARAIMRTLAARLRHVDAVIAGGGA